MSHNYALKGEVWARGVSYLVSYKAAKKGCSRRLHRFAALPVSVKRTLDGVGAFHIPTVMAKHAPAGEGRGLVFGCRRERGLE